MSRTLIVTGASGGIATALIERGQSAGWQVVAVSRQAMERPGVVAIQADVSTPAGAAAVFELMAARGLSADALAHMAGNTLIAPMARTSAEQFRGVMAANADSAFFALQAFVAHLRAAQKPGAAVLASSVVAQMGTPNHEAIAMAKGAVEALVRAAAATHAAHGIRVNAVAPGLTDTPMTAGITRNAAMREGASKQYPINGINSSADVANVVWWLLGDESARITGQVWAVDGGFTSIRPLVK